MNDYKAFVAELTQICDERGLARTSIGSVEGNELYRVQINPHLPVTFCIIGGIHGDEIGGPHGILYWLKNASLPSDIGMDIFPLVNAYGYIHNQRYNHKYDMNRQWNDPANLEDENKLLFEAMKGKEYKLLLTLHEDPGQEDGFYLYCSDRNNAYLWSQCVDAAKNYFKIYDKEEVYGDPIVNGLGWQDTLKATKENKCLETWFWERGLNYVTTETSDQYPLDDRQKYFAELIDMIYPNYR